MQAALLSLFTSLATNPAIQKLVLGEISKIPGVGGIASEILGMFAQVTAPTSTSKTVAAGPSPTIQGLQAALNAAGASPQLKADGYYGPKTDAALRAEAAKLGVRL